MDEKNGKNPLLALTVATVLFAALGIMVYNPAPYKGIRPPVPEVQEPSEKVRARLWQDPFQAVLDHEKAKEAKRKQDQGRGKNEATQDKQAKSKGVAGQDRKDSRDSCLSITKPPGLERKLAEEINKRGEVTVMGVMVMGGPYDDDMEFRIRMRYAVLAGLNVLQYYPDDPTHIDFARICPANAEKDGSQITLLNIIPFEWLVSIDQSKSVLLLWLNEDSFQGQPLTKLEDLKNSIKVNNFKIIGPATSTVLLDMIKENKETKLDIYSATATADIDILKKEAEKKLGKEIDLTTLFFPKIEVPKIHPTIRSDHELAKTLSQELKNRGVSDCDHIILVAEWDTYYGRLFIQRFEEVLEKDFCRNTADKRVHRFSYLRGIDGKLPGEPSDRAKEQKKNDTGSKDEKDVKKLEEPVGKSQYDYLRRLAEGIGRLEDKYGKGSIKAIGVLGNDFYDKFLVLQALRQRFPENIFFTTDLDARYLHPANIEWTRNLLVASTYGLQLHEDLQGDVPPFRDAYQTSVFAATLRAFDRLSPEHFRNLQPRIFEIGRSNAVDLSVRWETSPPINQVLPVQEFPAFAWQYLPFLVVLLPLLVVLLWLSCNWEPRKRKLCESISHLLAHKITISCLAFILILTTFFTYLHFAVLQKSIEEPFFLTEGISIWPTVLIRIIAMVSSYIFIALSYIWLRNNKLEIEDEFCLGAKCKESEVNWSRMYFNGNKINVNAEIDNYFRESQWRKRILWIIIIATIYFVLCGFIINLFETPISPVRGTRSGQVEFYILLLNIFSFLFLTFFVLDNIMLCRRFLANFYERQPQWDLCSLKAFMKKWLKDRDLLTLVGTKAEEALSDWMLIQLVARRTEVVGKLIFFPFIIWFLMFLSRHYYFDNWRTPPGLAIVISISPLLAWSCAVYLRSSAEKLRTVVSKRLAKLMMGAYATAPPDKTEADRLQYVLKEVKDIKSGAFASYLQQPVLQSLLFPLGGISGLKVLEFLLTLR